MRSDKALVFGSTARLKLLNCLKEKSKTVEELIGVCGLSQSAVSQHLRKLKDMGFVKGKKVGRKVYYSLTKKQLGVLSGKILGYLQNI